MDDVEYYTINLAELLSPNRYLPLQHYGVVGTLMQFLPEDHEFMKVNGVVHFDVKRIKIKSIVFRMRYETEQRVKVLHWWDMINFEESIMTKETLHAMASKRNRRYGQHVKVSRYERSGTI